MTFSIHTFEITLIMVDGKFKKLLSKAYEMSADNHRLVKKKEEYKDHIFDKKGVKIRLSKFWANGKMYGKVCFIVNPSKLLGGDDLNLWEPNKSNNSELIKRLENCIDKYFESKVKLDDFVLSRVDFTVNIQVGSKKAVAAYIEILRKLGKIKGFSDTYDKSKYDWYDGKLSFDLTSKSDDTQFTAYDKQGAMIKKGGDQDAKRVEAANGILRIEVKLTKPKIIKKFTKETETKKQIKDLSKQCKKIFFETFKMIVPFGDFYTKKKSIELINENIGKKKHREKMIELLELIPTKKSLYLAKKEINDRNVDKTIDLFASINLSPLTISKRSGVKHLQSLYDYLL